MRNIQLPPTRDDVIRQILKISQEVATDCGDEFALLMCNLACAKIAGHIQIEESPKFDKCFIQFGQFHALLSTYSSLGTMIGGEWRTMYLSEADMIAMGSMRKFLKDKMYNRCKRGPHYYPQLCKDYI